MQVLLFIQSRWACGHNVLNLFGRNPYILAGLASLHAKAGARDEVVKVLQELMEITRGGTIELSQTVIAFVHVALGEHDEAMDWLQRAYDDREYTLVYLKMDPAADPLRQDPRFQDLMRRMNFPE